VKAFFRHGILIPHGDEVPKAKKLQLCGKGENEVRAKPNQPNGNLCSDFRSQNDDHLIIASQGKGT
jgi:hypothetical protein